MYCQYFCNYNSVDRERGSVEVVFDADFFKNPVGRKTLLSLFFGSGY